MSTKMTYDKNSSPNAIATKSMGSDWVLTLGIVFAVTFNSANLYAQEVTTKEEKSKEAEVEKIQVIGTHIMG